MLSYFFILKTRNYFYPSQFTENDLVSQRSSLTHRAKCDLIIDWQKTDLEPQRLRHRVDLKGLERPTSFMLTLDPEAEAQSKSVFLCCVFTLSMFVLFPAGQISAQNSPDVAVVVTTGDRSIYTCKSAQFPGWEALPFTLSMHQGIAILNNIQVGGNGFFGIVPRCCVLIVA